MSQNGALETMENSLQPQKTRTLIWYLILMILSFPLQVRQDKPSPEQRSVKLQDADESLSRPRSIADGAPSAAAGENFFRRDGLLYRRYSPPGADSDAHDIEQLVLPTELRPTVLKLAHDVPMAGHLGKKKTTDRILNRFYWSGLFRDVEKHCRSCGQCQKLSTRKVKKAPLVPLPIMDEPFRRIAMDIVGPLPRSSSENGIFW